MTNDEVETIYSALAECIHRAGKERASVLLATLALDLLHRLPSADAALEHIRLAEKLTEP